ncbi:L-fucose:H+ symporter permease [Rhodanobacter sp. DHG33]|uniref:L-fucose:H+ symporter permease n=1 Tax=Rhodanobacter sp. DHG33 TaxID=2775921 RepID=UPI001783744C|nr:L-fucose:H+ symporter permease [Rhodanobacter sp. DHG33]MBD8899813.1 L-fucose:H+ symporter permease [Rhodanobacter sp. DHG33]
MAFASAPSPSSTVSNGADSGRYTDYPGAFAVTTAVFFMWGFLTALNDSLIPHLKAVFELDYTRAMLVQFTFFGAYFLMSLPSGWLVERLGFKRGMVTGLAIAGVGAAAFWPAAQWHSYALFLGALFVLATGITVLQVAANPYVALLGPARTGSSRLTLAQALNSLGTTLAPLFGAWLILSNTVLSGAQIDALPAAQQLAYRTHEAQSVQGPYLGLALVLVLLAVIVWLFRLPSLSENTQLASGGKHTLLDALRVPHVKFGVIAIFCYVGAEVSIGSFMINYISLPQIGHISEQQASHYVSLYWGGAMVGRLFGSALLAWLDPRKLLAAFAAIAGLLVVTSMLSSSNVAMVSIIAVGLFNSIMFPTIFALGIERLGPLTDKASSLLIMAIVGGALVPLLQGVLADQIGIQHAFVLPLLCYAYIIFYGRSGSKIRDAAVR